MIIRIYSIYYSYKTYLRKFILNSKKKKEPENIVMTEDEDKRLYLENTD